jgi:hypothetical protein
MYPHHRMDISIYPCARPQPTPTDPNRHTSAWSFLNRMGRALLAPSGPILAYLSLHSWFLEYVYIIHMWLSLLPGVVFIIIN